MPTAVEKKILERRRFDVKMVMGKKLPKIDLSSNYARLNIPKIRMRVGFPTKEGQENLEKRKKDGKHCEDLIVSLTEPNFKSSVWSFHLLRSLMSAVMLTVPKADSLAMNFYLNKLRACMGWLLRRRLEAQFCTRRLSPVRFIWKLPVLHIGRVSVPAYISCYS